MFRNESLFVVHLSKVMYMYTQTRYNRKKHFLQRFHYQNVSSHRPARQLHIICRHYFVNTSRHLPFHMHMRIKCAHACVYKYQRTQSIFVKRLRNIQ